MSRIPQDPQYPDHVLATLEQVEMLKLNGEHDKSISLAQKLLVEDPDCVGALEEIADNYVSLEEHEKAEKAANRALQLDRNSFTAYYILGFLASNQQKWELALEFLKRANVSVFFNKAWNIYDSDSNNYDPQTVGAQLGYRF